MTINKWIPLTICASSLLLASCLSKKPITSTSYQKHTYANIDSTITRNAIVDSFLNGYAHMKDSIMSEVIGQSAIPLTKNQPESTAGNFMADAQLEGAQKIDPSVVGSVINYGSIRTNYISSGNIPLSSIYEIMPFDNMLTIIEVPGSTLQEFCDHMAQRGGWPIAGFSYQISDNKAINIKVNDKAINPNIIYKIAVSDYLSTGGDECDFLEGLKKEDHSIFIRDLLINYVKEHKNINPKIENRIHHVK